MRFSESRDSRGFGGGHRRRGSGNLGEYGDGFSEMPEDNFNTEGHGPRQAGVVKFFNNEKGYGFITPEGGGGDVFVHISAVERSNVGELDKGVKVSFETEPDKRGKGPKAVNLQSLTDHSTDSNGIFDTEEEDQQQQ